MTVNRRMGSSHAGGGSLRTPLRIGALVLMLAARGIDPSLAAAPPSSLDPERTPRVDVMRVGQPIDIATARWLADRIRLVAAASGLDEAAVPPMLEVAEESYRAYRDAAEALDAGRSVDSIADAFGRQRRIREDYQRRIDDVGTAVPRAGRPITAEEIESARAELREEMIREIRADMDRQRADMAAAMMEHDRLVDDLFGRWRNATVGVDREIEWIEVTTWLERAVAPPLPAAGPATDFTLTVDVVALLTELASFGATSERLDGDESTVPLATRPANAPLELELGHRLRRLGFLPGCRWCHALSEELDEALRAVLRDLIAAHRADRRTLFTGAIEGSLEARETESRRIGRQSHNRVLAANESIFDLVAAAVESVPGSNPALDDAPAGTAALLQLELRRRTAPRLMQPFWFATDGLATLATIAMTHEVDPDALDAARSTLGLAIEELDPLRDRVYIEGRRMIRLRAQSAGTGSRAAVGEEYRAARARLWASMESYASRIAATLDQPAAIEAFREAALKAIESYRVSVERPGLHFAD